MEFELTEEQVLIQQTAKDFAEGTDVGTTAEEARVVEENFFAKFPDANIFAYMDDSFTKIPSTKVA